MIIQPPGLKRGARLGQGFVSPRIRSKPLLFASRTAAEPQDVQECISVLGKLSELGMGEKHQADSISACTHTTSRICWEEGNLRKVSFKTCGFGESV